MWGITGIESLDYRIMNSDAAVDTVIALFESAAEQGYAPDEVEDEVFNQAGVDPADLTSADKNRIQVTVNELWRMISEENRREL